VDPHQFDTDPDSTDHPDADPDSDFYLMRIRFRLGSDPVPAYHFDPDPDFYLMRILMRIRIFIGCGCGSRLPK
jgi:hypothetical protein